MFCAYAFNISLIMFRTGSMEPTIPASSVAAVQEIEASQVEVGDVLTVDRPGQLPVTHRVTSVSAGSTAHERVITMQGDANEAEDPAPYVITEARQVLFSVPGAANAVSQMSNPYVLGGVTLGASVLVMWAFWPKGTGRSPVRAARTRSRSVAASEAPGSEEKDARRGDARAQAAPVSAPAGDTRRARRMRRESAPTMILMITLGAGSIILATPDRAAAQPDEELLTEVVTSRYFTLTSTYRPDQRVNMTPGSTAVWDLAVDAETPTPGSVSAGIAIYGDFPLVVSVQRCSSEWAYMPRDAQPAAWSCSEAPGTVLDDSIIASDGTVEWFYEFSSEEEVWLRVMTTLPDGVPVPPEAESLVRVYIEGAALEDGLVVDNGLGVTGTPSDGSDQGLRDPDGELAQSGFGLLWLATVALGTVAVGNLLRAREKKSMARHEY
ncbi:hypothetical protein GCM10025777_45140 [Membranihabitans marinus]|uniref:Signal peptidase I n=2 Tax=Nesterenkonia rhizosphaerae TaxID=1348272 RepID=A0ABP9FXV2_9MICC